MGSQGKVEVKSNQSPQQQPPTNHHRLIHDILAPTLWGEAEQ